MSLLTLDFTGLAQDDPSNLFWISIEMLLLRPLLSGFGVHIYLFIKNVATCSVVVLKMAVLCWGTKDLLCCPRRSLQGLSA